MSARRCANSATNGRGAGEAGVRSESMARQATGSVVERRRSDGRVFALRFRAYGRRRYLTLGTAERAGPAARPRRSSRSPGGRQAGIWGGRATAAESRSRSDLPRVRFGVAGSAAPRICAADRRGLRAGPHPPPASVLRQAQAVGDHCPGGRPLQGAEGPRARAGLVERPLSNRTINKTLTRLGQILDVAVRYELMTTTRSRPRSRS